MSANPAVRRVHSVMEQPVARPSRPDAARLVRLAIGFVVLAASAAGCAPPQTGAAVAVLPVDGAPGGLALAPAPQRPERRLYALEATPAAGWWLPDACEHMTYGEHLTAAGRWAVLCLSPADLEVESRQEVGQPLHASTVAPDGDRAYALGAWGAVVSLDLTSGRTSHLATLPDTGLGLAVSAAGVYVPHTYGDAVWAPDRRDGRRLQTIATGRHPIGVTMGEAHPR